MHRITLAIYKYFQKHKAIYYTLLIATFGIFVYFGSKIQFEEDISKLLPSENIGNSEQLVFNNLKVKDKIFILFNPKNNSVSQDELIQACDAFSDSLLTQDKDSIIDNILYKLDDEIMLNAISYLYGNLPCFLDDKDYALLDSAFTDKSLDNRMQANYDDLMSATGTYSYELISQDPAGLRYAFQNKALALSDAFGGNYKILDGHFFTPDSSVLVSFLTPNFTGFDSKTGTLLVEDIEAQIAKIQQEYPNIEILFHGAPIQSVFNSRQIKKDLILTIGISLLFACALIWFIFKDKNTIPLFVAPVLYGVVFALFCLYLAQGIMSLMAIGIGAIVLGVALSYFIHMLTHHKYVNDAEHVLIAQTKPLFLSSLTTIGAFLGLLFTSSALLSDFGLFASLSLIGTTIFCLIFIPPLLNKDSSKRSEKSFAILEKINSYPFDKNKFLVCILFIVSGICIYTSTWVSFDTDLKNIGYNEPAVVRSTKLLADKTAKGNTSLYFATIANSLDSALTYNKALALKLDSLKQTNDIESCANTSVILQPNAYQLERINKWNEYFTADKKAQVKQAIIKAGTKYDFTAEVFEPFFNAIDKKYEPSNIYEANVLPQALLSNFIEHTDGKYLIFTPVQLKPEKYNQSCDIITTQNHVVVIDPFYYTQDMVRILTDNFNVILAISSIFVLLVLLASFKSLTIALIAFFPMMLNWYIVQGMMGIFGMQFNLINIIISSFIFGVGVDYSIFVMDGLLRSTRKESKLLMQHKSAILLSGIVLIMSVSSLIFASHPALYSIGVTTFIGMTSTLLVAYTLQPFVFNQLMKFKYFKTIVEKHNTEFKPD